MRCSISVECMRGVRRGIAREEPGRGYAHACRCAGLFTRDHGISSEQCAFLFLSSSSSTRPALAPFLSIATHPEGYSYFAFQYFRPLLLSSSFVIQGSWILRTAIQNNKRESSRASCAPPGARHHPGQVCPVRLVHPAPPSGRSLLRRGLRAHQNPARTFFH